MTGTRLYLEAMEIVLAGRKKLIIDGSRFGKRQMLFVDPQGIPITPGQADAGKTTPPEERKQKQ